MRKKNKFGWFLFGLGGQLQILASLSMTELFVLIATLVIGPQEIPHMRRNGVMPFFYMSIALWIGGTISGLVNRTPFAGMLRGEAVLVLLPCSIIVTHWMLRRDMTNFKWTIVGGLFSGWISTFFFQNAFLVGAMGNASGNVAAEDVIGGPLWLVHRVGDMAMLFPKGWYLQCPLLMSAILPLALAAFALFTSTSGRGTAVRSLCSAVLVLLGGKKRSTIRRRVCGHMGLLILAGGLAVAGFKTFYQTAASSGVLGEKARQKYESQTKGDKSLKALLLGGRLESFCGLVACVDRPILGFGPWAMDRWGYVGEFLAKYGTAEDYANYERSRQSSSGVGMIPCHAYLSQFWCWYGIMGLLFWLYVIFLFARYLKQDCYAVPQYYMWLAAGIPSFLWDIFFNPFANRVGTMMFIVAILIVRAVRRGRQPLPFTMQQEIFKAECR